MEAYKTVEGGEETVKLGRGSSDGEVAGCGCRLEREVNGGRENWRG